MSYGELVVGLVIGLMIWIIWAGWKYDLEIPSLWEMPSYIPLTPTPLPEQHPGEGKREEEEKWNGGDGS